MIIDRLKPRALGVVVLCVVCMMTSVLIPQQTGPGGVPGPNSGTTGSSLTMNSSGSGSAPGSSFNGSAPIILSYNTLSASGLAANNIFSANNTFTSNVEADTNLNLGNTTGAAGQLKFFSGSGQEASLAADANNIYFTSSGNIPLTLGDAAGAFVFKISNSSAVPILTVPSSGSVVVAVPIKTPNFTVSTLPSASTSGVGAQVTISDATTFTPGTCTGGGSDYMIAISNGTTWSCH